MGLDGGFVVEVEKAQMFFSWALAAFSGNAHISFEGKFPIVTFHGFPGSSTAPNAILTRQTSQPTASFLIFPVEQETKDSIIKSVLPRIGLRHNVYHVHIEKEGQLVLAAVDNLSYCWIAHSIPTAELDALKDSGVIRSFKDCVRAT